MKLCHIYPAAMSLEVIPPGQEKTASLYKDPMLGSVGNKYLPQSSSTRDTRKLANDP